MSTADFEAEGAFRPERAIKEAPSGERYGRVFAARGGSFEAAGVEQLVCPGSRCEAETRSGRRVSAEVISVSEGRVSFMPYEDVQDLGAGCRVFPAPDGGSVFPCPGWQGRVLDALGRPADGLGPVPKGSVPYPLRAAPPAAGSRRMLGPKIALGVKSLDVFAACREGQRLGIFAGSGVGKSVLMSMLTRYCSAEVKVIGLIGERGREVKEFLTEYLGPEGLRKAVIIVATGDETPLMRRRAAYLTMATAEYFRDRGRHVLCMMDSMTRFALAQREIGVAAGEPPMSRGYTPSVFSELPRLLERAGPGSEEAGQGMITGLFTVLVDGDDHNEPVADAVRGILDGHIVLDRAVAERGRYPAVHLLKSVSRTMPGCHTQEQRALVRRARELLSAYEDMRELIRLGAYAKGSDPYVDAALEKVPALEKFFTQMPDEASSPEKTFAELEKLL